MVLPILWVQQFAELISSMNPEIIVAIRQSNQNLQHIVYVASELYILVDILEIQCQC
jgi:hypothetical protein